MGVRSEAALMSPSAPVGVSGTQPPGEPAMAETVLPGVIGWWRLKSSRDTRYYIMAILKC